MPVETQTNVQGDILKMELDSRYCRASVTYTNGTGSAKTFGVGYPLVVTDSTGVAVMVLDTAEATTNALSLEEHTVENGDSITFTALVRGPAIINVDAMPILDIAGGDLIPATCAAGLLAEFPPILSWDEPAKTTEQVL